VTAAQDTFWLTHYTYNTINPLVEKAQAIEPSIQLGIQAVFGHPEAAHCNQHRIEVMLHWKREGMLAYSPWLASKADVDRWAATVQAKIDKLQPLEVGIPA
jgi:hypothetical protein